MHAKKTLSMFNKKETEPGEIGDRRKQIKIRTQSVKVLAVKCLQSCPATESGEAEG